MTKNEGTFCYLCQLYPDCCPQILKVGLSGNLAQRASKHKTLAPNLTFKCTHRGDSRDETRLIQILSGKGKLMGREVILCDPDLAVTEWHNYFRSKSSVA